MHFTLPLTSMSEPFFDLHSFSNKLFVIRLFSSSVFQTLLTLGTHGTLSPGSAHAAVQLVCCATLVDAALFSCSRITTQLSHICSNVHYWMALVLKELRHIQTQSLNTALFIYTDELVPNVLGIAPTSFSTFILGSDAIFSFVGNI